MFYRTFPLPICFQSVSFPTDSGLIKQSFKYFGRSEQHFSCCIITVMDILKIFVYLCIICCFYTKNKKNSFRHSSETRRAHMNAECHSCETRRARKFWSVSKYFLHLFRFFLPSGNFQSEKLKRTVLLFLWKSHFNQKNVYQYIFCIFFVVQASLTAVT